MNITELVGRAHDNAVKHGFWDPPLDFGTAIALIHSELSEALEEERAGRDMVWYKCAAGNGDGTICNPKRWIDCDMGGKEDRCPFRHKKARRRGRGTGGRCDPDRGPVRLSGNRPGHCHFRENGL